MLVAMAEDLRVVFIKLADRLHNMKTIDALPPEKRHSIARETLEIYCSFSPSPGHMGIEMAVGRPFFPCPRAEEVSPGGQTIAGRREEREQFIANVIQILNKEFEKAGLKAEVSGRPKHIYSIHEKEERYAAQGKDFSDIYDLLALRVLVQTVQDCYAALGIIHNLWHPITGPVDDFIANPKPNGLSVPAYYGNVPGYHTPRNTGTYL